jgi:hypothetical protein
VYICIPLWPEGDPGTVTMQGILFWQAETVRMMYSRVADAIKRCPGRPKLGQMGETGGENGAFLTFTG